MDTNLINKLIRIDIPEVQELREIAVSLCQDLNRDPIYTNVKKQDIKWFWDDLSILSSSDGDWDYINSNKPLLEDKYPIRVTYWLYYFYELMPENIWYIKNKDWSIDWALFFTLAYPLPSPRLIPFHSTIKKLKVHLTRKDLEDTALLVMKDISLLSKLVEGDMDIPPELTRWNDYSRLRRRVLDLFYKAGMKSIKDGTFSKNL